MHKVFIVVTGYCLNGYKVHQCEYCATTDFQKHHWKTSSVRSCCRDCYTVLQPGRVFVPRQIESGSRPSSEGVRDTVIATRTHQESVNCLMTLTMYFFKACCTDRTMFSSTCSKIVNQHSTLCVLDHILKNSCRKHLIWTIVIFSYYWH